MDEQKKAKLKKLAKLFNLKEIVTTYDIEQFLLHVLGVIKDAKTNIEELSSAHMKELEGAIAFIKEEYPKTVDVLGRAADDFVQTFEEKIAEINDRLDEIKAIKSTKGDDGYTPRKGVDYFDGTDAEPVNEARIVAMVMERIKLPEPQKLEVETGESIVAKINSLSTDDPSFQIDADHIKNLPKAGQTKTLAGGARFISQMFDVKLTDLSINDVLKWDGSFWVNSASSGGSGLSSLTSPSNTILIGGTLTDPTLDVDQSQSYNWSAPHTFDGISNNINGQFVFGASGSIVFDSYPTSRAALIGSMGEVTYSTTTDTEIGYLSGVTSAIQTQLNSKLSTAIISLNGLSGATQTFAAPAAGFSISSAGTAHTFALANDLAALEALALQGFVTRTTTGATATYAQRTISPGTGISVTNGNGSAGNPTITSNLSIGVAGGQSAIGGTGNGESLTLSSTTSGTKGSIIFGSLSNAFNQATSQWKFNTTSINGFVNIGAGTTSVPQMVLDVGSLYTLGDPLSGSIEYIGTGFYLTNSDNDRQPIVTTEWTQTIRNKNIKKRISYKKDTGTWSISKADADFFANEIGVQTALDTLFDFTDGESDVDMIQIRIQTDGSGITYTWSANVRDSSDLPLPTVSTGFTEYMLFQWNLDVSKWDYISPKVMNP